MMEVIAFSYAALKPTDELLEKFLTEYDNLESKNKVTEFDHQFLRSSEIVQRELMHVTQGTKDSLSPRAVAKTIDRVESKIREKETKMHQAEKDAHKQTRRERDDSYKMVRSLRERLYWKCQKQSEVYMWIASSIFTIFTLAGFGWVIDFFTSTEFLNWLLPASSFVLIIFPSKIPFTSIKQLAPVRKIYEWMRGEIFKSLLEKESAAIGFDLSKLE